MKLVVDVYRIHRLSFHGQYARTVCAVLCINTADIALWFMAFELLASAVCGILWFTDCCGVSLHLHD